VFESTGRRLGFHLKKAYVFADCREIEPWKIKVAMFVERMLCFKHAISLVAGAITILKNDGVRQWAWDDIPYIYYM
jgi:hypothetical protein